MLIKSIIGTVVVLCFVFVIGCGLFVFHFFSDALAKLKASTQPPAVQFINSSYLRISMDSKGMVTFPWTMTVVNTTKTDIRDIWVRMEAYSPEGNHFTSSIKVSNFYCLTFPHHGGLLPSLDCIVPKPVNLQLYTAYWTSDTTLFLQVTKIDYSKDQDLTKTGQLYAVLRSDTKDQAISMFKRHPDILKHKWTSGLNATLIAFATSRPSVIKYVTAHGGGSAKSTYSNGKVGIMSMAAMNPNVSALSLALKLGATSNDGNKKTTRSPLGFAILAHNTTNVSWLLDHHADPNFRDYENLDPLDMAVEEGDLDSLRILLKHGANLHSRDKGGQDILELAGSKYWMIYQIVEAGLPIDDRNPQNGDTPLMHDIIYPDINSQKILLELGANPNLKNKKGQNCYDLAKLNNTLHTDRFFKDIVASAKKAVSSGHLDYK